MYVFSGGEKEIKAMTYRSNLVSFVQSELRSIQLLRQIAWSCRMQFRATGIASRVARTHLRHVGGVPVHAVLAKGAQAPSARSGPGHETITFDFLGAERGRGWAYMQSHGPLRVRNWCQRS